MKPIGKALLIIGILAGLYIAAIAEFPGHFPGGFILCFASTITLLDDNGNYNNPAH